MKKIVLGIFLGLVLFGFAGRASAVQSDGKEDVSFYNNLNSAFGGSGASIFAIAVESDGDILVGGNFSTFNGQPRKGLVRLKADGTEDVAFYNSLDGGFTGGVYAIQIESDGQILVGGKYNFKNNTKQNLVRLNSNGNEDTNFYNSLGTSFSHTVYSLNLEPDGQILVGGNFTTFNGNTRKYLVRLNSNGSEDTNFYNSFSSSAKGGVRVITLEPDGQILIGGTFSQPNQAVDNFDIMRLNSNGLEDTAFHDNLPETYSGNVYDIKLQSNGKILVGGNLGGDYNYANSLVRLNTNGSIDLTFKEYKTIVEPYETYNNFVRTLAIDSDGQILVGGRFTSLGGITRNRLVRLNSNGITDTNFYSNLGSAFDFDIVEKITIDSQGRILVGGDFISFKNNPRNKLVRLTCCNLPPTATLSATPTNVDHGGATQLTWATENANTCTASSNPNNPAWTSSTSVDPLGGSILIGNLTVKTTFSLSCVGDGGNANSSVEVTVNPLLPIVNLSASPKPVAIGGETTLTQTVQNATTCTASAVPPHTDWTGNRNINASPKKVKNIQVDTTFTLTCSGQGQTSSASVTVNALPKPTVTLNLSKDEINSGESVDVTWTSTNANTCTASGGWTGSKDVAGGIETISNITTNKTFTLNCTNAVGSTVVSKNLTVKTVIPQPTISLSASPENVPYGGYTSLTWSSTNANTCNASGGWTGVKSPSGSQPILTPLTIDTIFTLSCNGAGGTAEKSVTVTVNPQAPSLIFDANPTEISSSGATTLTWATENTTTCNASNDQGIIAWTGNKDLNNSLGERVENIVNNTNFKLSCIGAGGEIEKSVLVSTVPVPNVNLTSSKVEVIPNTPFVLTWVVDNATSCASSNDAGLNSWTGPQDASDGTHTKNIAGITAKTIFTISCLNLQGLVANSSATVDTVKEGVSLGYSKVLQNKTKIIWKAVNVKECVATTNSEDDEVKNSWIGNKTSEPSPYDGQTLNVIVKSVLPEVTKYTITCKGKYSNQKKEAELNLHTKSLGAGAGIPDYEEN